MNTAASIVMRGPVTATSTCRPGLDFETKIFYKPNAVARLLDAWEKPGYAVKPITLGANTDPYQPAEKQLRITRGLLEAFRITGIPSASSPRAH